MRHKLIGSSILAGVIALITCYSFCFGREERTLAEEVASEIKEKLPDLLSQASIPGAAVAVVDGRNVIWEEAYGHVDDEDSRPVDATTTISIQSMTKGSTALALLMAVHDGLIDLDVPISEYLPQFKSQGGLSNQYDFPRDHLVVRPEVCEIDPGGDRRPRLITSVPSDGILARRHRSLGQRLHITPPDIKDCK